MCVGGGNLFKKTGGAVLCISYSSPLKWALINCIGLRCDYSDPSGK